MKRLPQAHKDQLALPFAWQLDLMPIPGDHWWRWAIQMKLVPPDYPRPGDRAYNDKDFQRLAGVSAYTRR